MEYFIVKKDCANVNGVFLSFDYSGKTKSTVKTSEKQVGNLANKFMYGLNHNDIARDVRFLRTIFSEYDEKSLMVSYQTDNEFEKIFFDADRVGYKNYFSYEYWKKNEDDIFIKHIGIEGDLDKLYDLSVSLLWNKKIDKYSFSPIDLELDDNKRELIQAYRLFYKENPDFTDENIGLKCQVLLAQLKENNCLTLFAFYNDIRYVSSDRYPYPCPYSRLLDEEVSELFPYGVITEDIDVLGNSDKKQISLLGDNMMSIFKQYPNEIDALGKLIDYSLDDRRSVYKSEKLIQGKKRLRTDESK